MKKKKSSPKKARSKVAKAIKRPSPTKKPSAKKTGAKRPVAKQVAKRPSPRVKQKQSAERKAQEGSVNQNQTDLSDDQVINAMLAAGERAQALAKKKTAADFDKDSPFVDAFAGCVMVMANASHDVSRTLWNWAGQVPWEYIDRVADWRKHGQRTDATRKELWQFAEGLPELLQALKTLTL